MPPVITIYGKQIKNVQNFKYMGEMLTAVMSPAIERKKSE